MAIVLSVDNLLFHVVCLFYVVIMFSKLKFSHVRLWSAFSSLKQQICHIVIQAL